jgi:hypothetical protein
MTYIESLQHPKVKQALTKAGITDIESSPYKDSDCFMLDDGIAPSDELIHQIVQMEINARARWNQLEQFKRDNAQALDAIEKTRQKMALIKPHFKTLIAGKMKEKYSQYEDDMAACLAERAASAYDFDDTGEDAEPDTRNLSELDKLLKQASVLKLSTKKSLDDIALETLYNSGFINFLK